jgi:hypothetical protein
MAKRWASAMLVGLGLAGLLPTTATAQGFPAMAEPMPMQAAPQAPFGQMTQGMQFAPTNYDGGNAAAPGMPMAPVMNPNACGPDGTPGVGLPMGATYYPGMGHDNCQEGIPACIHKLLYNDEGERRLFYGKIGYISLQRQSLPRTPLVALEPAFVVDNTTIPPSLRPTTDGDGDSTFGAHPFIFSMNQLSPISAPGVQAFIGLEDKSHDVMWEVGGFYTSNVRRNAEITAPGRLDSPYFNIPVGFQGDDGLWTNADYMQLIFVNSIYSGEINARFFGTCWKSLDINWLIGLRYVKLYERFSHYTIDDDIQHMVDDPTSRATLTWKAENDLFGLQVGFSATQRISEAWSISWDQKFMFLANGAQTAESLVRDDGFVGYDVAHTTWRYSQGFDGGLYLDFGGGNFRIRAGWDLKVFLGVAQADKQFTYDLQAAPTIHRSSGTTVYQGPSASLEFVF